MVNYTPVPPIAIDADDFDKTFTLYGDKVIGAYCGLLCFSGKTVAEHVADIIASIKKPKSIMDLAEAVRDEIISRLGGISNVEVDWPFRKIDMLLVGGERLKTKDQRIIAIRFYPENQSISATIEIHEAGACKRYCTFGEENAAKAAGGAMKNPTPNLDAEFITNQAKAAVQVGIAAAGVRPHSMIAACGGTIFARRTSNK